MVDGVIHPQLTWGMFRPGYKNYPRTIWQVEQWTRSWAETEIRVPLRVTTKDKK